MIESGQYQWEMFHLRKRYLWKREGNNWEKPTILFTGYDEQLLAKAKNIHNGKCSLEVYFEGIEQDPSWLLNYCIFCTVIFAVSNNSELVAPLGPTLGRYWIV